MAFIALLVIGYIASSRIPLAMLPGGFEQRWLGMWVSYRNASPTEVEHMIARPLEGMLRTLGGVERIYTSSSHGGCWAYVRFRQSVDLDEAYNRFRDRIDRIKVELPEDVDYIRVIKRGTDDIPILWISFAVSEDRSDLYDIVEQQIMQPIERIDGVARVVADDVDPSRAEIEIVQDRANAHGVGVYELVQQLRRDNFSLTSGFIRQGAQKLYVRSDSRFGSLAEIENLPIEGHPGLRVRDIALVTYGPREQRFYERMDGERSFSIAVFKESMANSVQTSREVVELLQDDLMTRDVMQDFEMRVLFDQGLNITRSLDQLRSAGLWGGFFALFVLYFFLRRVRMTLVITGAIPLSVLVSLGTMYLVGWSLNVITMMGLIIGVGMVVDNSIVVVEAIYARRLSGESPFKSALHGASEVGLAITMSTLTTVVVFLPLIFMSGEAEMSFYMARIGMPVIFALLGSLLVALLFIPLVTSRLMSGKPPAEPRSITAASGLYTRALNWVMTHRVESVVLVLAAFWSISIPAGGLAKSTRGGGRFSPRIYVRFDMPDHYDLAATDSVLAHYERFMGANRELYGVKTIDAGFRPGRARIRGFIELDDRQWYTIVYHDIMDKIGLPVYARLSSKDAIAHFRDNAPRFPGVEMNIDRSDEGEARSSVTLFGDDTPTLVRLAGEVERRLRGLPSVKEVDSDMEDGDQELRLSIDRDRARHYGLDGRTVASSLGYALRGMPLRAYRTDDREVDLRIRLREEDRMTLDQVLNMPVVGRDGATARIGNLVSVEVGRGLDRISRENGKTRVRVTAVSTERDTRNLARQIRGALEGFELPRGYQWTLSGRFEQMKEEEGDMTFAIIMSTLFVLLLMGILFESFVLPFSVIVSIPFSFLGVYWLLWLTGTTLDMMARIGTIVLIGVVVNNAIVLVDLVNRLRAEGWSRHDAIIEAGRNRIRPIVMTSATTIFGLLPMALGNSDMAGISYVSMGRAMIGGLVTSTGLTLFVVPLFYSFLDDLRQTSARLARLTFARKASPTPEPVPVPAPDAAGR